MLPRQPIKLSDLNECRMKQGRLFNKYFSNVVRNMENYSINILLKKSNIPNETAENVNFHFSYYKSVENISCNSSQSSHPTGIKT